MKVPNGFSYVSGLFVAVGVLLTTGTNALATSTPPAGPANSPRYDKGMQVLRDLNNGQPQPVFEAMRREFPFLAESTASYALGDVWGREVLDPKTRQLAAMAAFASAAMKRRARSYSGLPARTCSGW